MAPRRIARILLLILRWLLTTLVAVIVLAWLAGRLWSDRSLLTQWLLWIPTPTLLPVVGLGLLATCSPGSKRWWKRTLVRTWLVIGVLVVLHFTLVEHRFLRPGADAGDAVCLVNWNMTYSSVDPPDAGHADPLLSLLGDVTVLVNSRGVHRNLKILQNLPPGMTVVPVGHVTILSRLPLIEARPIVLSDCGSAVLVRVGDVPGFERPLTLYVVDLPSDPRRSRADVTRRLRTHLNTAGAPPPDVVLGDFNIARGSASLRNLFPTLHHAYDEGGHGYGASFHREFPL